LGRIEYRKSEIIAVVKLMIGAAIISFSSVWVKLANVAPTVSGFYRVFIGGVVLFAICIVRREKLWGGAGYLAIGVACGLVFALDLFAWHRSVLYIGPGLATILPNLQVFLLAMFGILYLGERPDFRFYLAMPLAVFGLFLLVGIGWDTLRQIEKTGIAFGLIAAVFYAGYTLSLRRLQTHPKALHPIASLALVSLISAGFLLAGAVSENQSLSIPDSRSVLALVAMGVFSQVIGWVLITGALPVIRASLAGLLLLLQPTLAFVWDMLFFHRPTTAVALVGVVTTLFAIYLGILGSTNQKRVSKGFNARKHETGDGR
jgi:drug/metabolite transporter (DMT)-like permease